MGRAPCCDKFGLKKGPWTPDEDQKLIAYIQEHGHGSWRALPKLAGLLRCGKSCRLRWTNYLRPDIKRGRFTSEEERMIIQLHAILGNRWSAIASHLAGRTDNEIKNYWNTHLKKRLVQMGIDPVTHKPKSEIMDAANGRTEFASSLSHMAQWESARLEAEARLAKCSKYPATIQARNEKHPTDLFLQAWKSEAGQAFRMLPQDHTSCRVDLSNFLHSWEQSLQGLSFTNCPNMPMLTTTLPKFAASSVSPTSTLCSVESTCSKDLHLMGQKHLMSMVKVEDCEASFPKLAIKEEDIMHNGLSLVFEAARSCDSESGTVKIGNFSTLLKEVEMASDESTITSHNNPGLASFNGGFPADLLMDFVEHSSTEAASTSCINQAAITSWPNEASGEINGDEWSNLLKFTGPPPCLQS